MENKSLIRFTILLFAGLLIVSGCGSEGGQKPSGTTDSTAVTPQDSGTTQPRGESLGADSAGLGTVTDTGLPTDLKGRVEGVIAEVLGEDFKDDKAPQTDIRPIFQSAAESRYHRMRKREPIEGSRVIPRLGLKAWRFENEKSLTATVEEWLNGHEHSDADTIRLGENVDNMKSPPLLGASNDTQLFMLSSSSLYSGAYWDEIVKRWESYFRKLEMKHIWRVHANSGKLTYF